MFRRVFQNYQDNIINPRTIPESDRPRTIWLVKYFELYKNGAFPIDLEMAKSDHDFLDNDVCKAFLRRLKVLNKYSTIVIPNRDILRRNYLKITCMILNQK